MFERFTEPARRALFFARYETSQIGGVAIEPEHLLLGLAREGTGIVNDLFARASLDLASIHEALAPINRPLERTPPSQEIPFGRATLDVLRLASEEADSMRHREIGPEHLLLGLLRQGRSIAFDVLTRAGVKIGDIRARAEAQRPKGRSGSGF
jgi:ATP-dependent Clp protease ATP-binding subunit ClpC